MSVVLKDMGLENLVKALKTNKFVAKVGIVGDSSRADSAGDDAPSNADIGLIHEFGTSLTPARSFLRMPLTTKLQKKLEDSGAFEKEALKNIIDEKSFENFMIKAGKVGEVIVRDAFSTGGFGKWKQSNMKYKKNRQTLVETQQLRDSISSEVISDN